jgi:hypothetical protein
VRLTEGMKPVVTEQCLGFVATVRPDGAPALSPQRTTRVRGDRPAAAPPAHAVVVIDVERAQELISPAYDDGTPEAVVAERWRRHHLAPSGGPPRACEG